ncbi:uncharacterized protein [Leptinotarsa decemlineata]|uniref:uncharacterized protein n=1 Tax=Leptinotarsa decemlineata TaxID=7539 RepID=UPI003D3054BC
MKIVLLGFSLLFRIIATQYTIKPINNTLGIYYHEDSDMVISNENWKLLVNKNTSVLHQTYENNNRILESLLTIFPKNIETIQTRAFFAEVKTHISLLTQLSKSIQEKFQEISLDSKRYKRGIIDGIGTIFKAITGNLDASDGEYYTNCINKINNDEHELENLMKNQISVTTSVIKNFNNTIRKLQIDEETFNRDIQVIQTTLQDYADEFSLITIKLKFLELADQLMISYNYIEENLDDILNAITFARLGIIHSSIITPEQLVSSLQEISQSLQRHNLPLLAKTSKIAQYLEIIELEAFQTQQNLIFILKIPLIDSQIFTMYNLFPIPIKDNRTDLHHVLSVNSKYIAKDDDSLLYAIVPDPKLCKTLLPKLLLCSKLYVYPINEYAPCEAKLFRNSKVIPDNCQSLIIYTQGYNIQQLEDNIWLIIVAEPLHITINCESKNTVTEVIYRNCIFELKTSCNAFIGITKVQAISKYAKDSTYVEADPHSISIPYDCCADLPAKLKLPDLKPLKLSNLNIDDLEIAKHKLDQNSKVLDDLINEPFVNKHVSWFTYFTITIVVIIIIVLCCYQCKRRRRAVLAIQPGDSPPSPPSDRSRNKSLRRILRILPRRRPNIREYSDEDDQDTPLRDFSP